MRLFWLYRSFAIQDAQGVKLSSAGHFKKAIQKLFSTFFTFAFTDTMCAPRLGREAFRVFIPKMLTGLM